MVLEDENHTGGKIQEVFTRTVHLNTDAGEIARVTIQIDRYLKGYTYKDRLDPIG